MELGINDPNFLLGEITDPVYRDSEWANKAGFSLRTPRHYSPAALILFVKGLEDDLRWLESCQSWIFVVSEPKSFESFNLERLGIDPRQSVIIFFDEFWKDAPELMRKLEFGEVLFVSKNDLSAKKTLAELEARTKLQLRVLAKSSFSSSTKITFFIPSTFCDLLELDSNSLLTYPSHRFVGNRLNTWCWMLSILATSPLILACGGSLRALIHRTMSGLDTIPNFNYLGELLGSPSYYKSTFARIVIKNGHLYVRGYNVSEASPGRAWHSRSHLIKLIGPVTKTIPLGAVRREIFDSVPLSANDSVNTFAGFSVGKNIPVPVYDLPIGEYDLHIIDESGYDIVRFGRVELSPADQIPGRSFHLTKDEGRAKLIIEENGLLSKKSLTKISIIVLPQNEVPRSAEEFLFETDPEEINENPKLICVVLDEENEVTNQQIYDLLMELGDVEPHAQLVIASKNPNALDVETQGFPTEIKLIELENGFDSKDLQYRLKFIAKVEEVLMSNFAEKD